MAEAPDAKPVVEEFLARQREMYAGGDLAAVEELLAEDVVWHVPGMSPIAARFGHLDGADRRLTAAAVDVRYLAPVRSDDELRIEVALDRLTERSIQVHYDAFVDDARVAEASSRHVCVDRESGEPASLPDGIAG
jgi:thioesterase superfamily protein